MRRAAEFLLVSSEPLRFTAETWAKAQFVIREFQPATKVVLEGDPPVRIRVTTVRGNVEVAPGLLAQIIRLAGTGLEVQRD